MTITYTWRSDVANGELNELHAEAFETRVFDEAEWNWEEQLHGHSLGWVVARRDHRLIGFVNVPWDGLVHAWIQDTMVAADARHQRIGTELVAVAVREARAAGCERLHVDFEDHLKALYFDACGFRPTPDSSESRGTRVHPNEALLRREYEARASGDDRGLAEVLADDVVWHVPGGNTISDEYRGIDQVMEYVRRRREISAGTFEITVHDMLANDEHGLVIATGKAIRDGTALEWRAHGLYRFRDGRITECWVLPENQYEFDRIWG